MKKLLLFFLLLPTCLFAQHEITGRIINSTDQQSIKSVNVFLNSTEIGASTQSDGTFILRNVKNGQYDLVVSYVGFVTAHESIFVSDNDIHVPAILLDPKNFQLSEVKINPSKSDEHKGHLRASKPEEDKGYLRRFIREFFGSTKNADECKILNPKVLVFNYDDKTDKLTATAKNYLLIENKALGYHIKYFLESFVYNPLAKQTVYTGAYSFKKMDTTAAQEAIWEKRRANAYLGSEIHFLRSCINGKANDYFTVFKIVSDLNADRPADSIINAKIRFFTTESALRPEAKDSLNRWINMSKMPDASRRVSGRPLYVYEFAKATPQKGVYKLFGDNLMINYLNKRDYVDKRTTLVNLDKEALFDDNGVIFTPQKVNIERYWGTLRIADLLPVDYELPKGFKIN